MKNRYPLVSVVVPIYNVENYLEKCIDSIINQTYTNLDIILVNDGSTDNSKNILNKYINDNRCSIIDKSNGGISSARNAGFNIAKGEYTLYVDSDDWLELTAVEQLVSKMQSVQADICCFGFAFVRAKNDKRKEIRPNYDGILKQPQILEEAFKGSLIKTTAWSKIYRTEYLRKNNIVFYEGIINEDYEYLLQCSTKAKSVTFYNEILYYAFERDNSISRDIKPQNISVLDFLYNRGIEIVGNDNRMDAYGYKKQFLGSYSKLVLYSLVQAAYRATDYKSFVFLYDLDKGPYADRKIGENIRLIDKKLYPIYLLSKYPKLFYYLIKVVKSIGLHLV